MNSTPLDFDAGYRYKVKPTLMTPTELQFYQYLVTLVPEYRVMSKVRLGDLIEPDEVGERWRPAFNRIRSKQVDFVIIDPTTSRIVLAIELDDPSHNREDRRERDDLINSIVIQSRLNFYRHPVGQPLSREHLRI